METFTIELRNIHIWANHGVMRQEKIVGNEFLVSVGLTIDATPFVKSEQNGTESMKHTIDYSIIADIVRAEMATSSELLESVAYRIANRVKVLQHIRIYSGFVEIVKQTPPLGLCTDGASVRYSW